jgi:hypothetical protein
MCGARKSIASPVDFLEVDLVHQAVASADAQQAIGRLRCRRIKDGKALPVRVYISHLDDKDRNFKTRLMRAFPKVAWKDKASENRLKKSQAYQVMLVVKGYVEANYQGKPIPTKTLMDLLDINRLGNVSEQVFRIAIRLFLKENPEWIRPGRAHALVKAVDHHGFKDETVTAA